MTASSTGAEAPFVDLRVSLLQAARLLGDGFVQHPGNSALRDALERGELLPGVYYGHVLRVVFRLIFVLIADERGGLVLPDAPPALGQTRARNALHHRLDHVRTAPLPLSEADAGEQWVAL